MNDRAFDAERRLPCGRTVGMLLTYLVDRTPSELAEHIRSCPHCRAELEALDQRWESVRNAAQAPVVPPTGLVERALTTVRGVRAGDGSDPIEIAQEGGSLTISARSVLTLARQSCSEILLSYPGVHLRACGGDVEQVRVDLLVRYPLPAQQIAEDVRSRLDDAMRQSLGAGTPSVWVQVSDVAAPSGG